MGKRTWIAAVVVCATALGGCGSDDGTSTGEKTSTTAKKRSLPSYVEDAATGLTAAGCAVEAPPLAQPLHEDSPGPSDWTSDPPSSGPHIPVWAEWGFYDEPVPDGYLVHNMEHGGVVFWYGPKGLSPAQKAALQDDLDPGDKWVVAPRPDLEGDVLAAWGLLARCPTDAVAKLKPAELTKLADTWYDDTHSQETQAEHTLPAFAYPEDTSKLTPALPSPVKSTATDPEPAVG